jgi:hypothetical protein
MKIEVLYVPNCPNHAQALQRLREVLPVESFQENVSEVLVEYAERAHALKFPGSPTIRVNGRDVEPQSEKGAKFGLMCRLYSDGSGAPSKERLVAAIALGRQPALRWARCWLRCSHWVVVFPSHSWAQQASPALPSSWPEHDLGSWGFRSSFSDWGSSKFIAGCGAGRAKARLPSRCLVLPPSLWFCFFCSLR